MSDIKALLAHADNAEAEISAGTLPTRVQLLVDGIRELAANSSQS